MLSVTGFASLRPRGVRSQRLASSVMPQSSSREALGRGLLPRQAYASYAELWSGSDASEGFSWGVCRS